MNRSLILRKTALLLLLGALLAAPWAAAAEGRPEPAGAVTLHALLARLWERIAALWGAGGATIDPYGNRAGSPAGEEPAPPDYGDEGSHIDPYG